MQGCPSLNQHWSALPERFEGRTLGVATMHGKESVIGPPLLSVLPIAGYVAIDGVDTDRFGAFSGEVHRAGGALETAIEKAKHGAEVSDLDLVIASEGSFGPYPLSPFISCDEEYLVLYDARDGAIYQHRQLFLETVFGGEECTSVEQVRRFAQRMKFPDHGLVLRSKEICGKEDRQVKGIHHEERLIALAAEFISANGTVWSETDMRAMANPTRMKAIGATAERFAMELARGCPACGHFFFRVNNVDPGLPCALCGLPTNSVHRYVRECGACGFKKGEPRPDGKVMEQPQFCDHCNP